MRSKWIEHKSRKIFYQDFSGLHFNSDDIKSELREVQAVVLAEPSNSVLALSDFRDTHVDHHLLSDLNASSRATKQHLRKTAVLGITGVKRTLADLLSALTGLPLKYFDDIESAKNWLVEK